MNHIFRVVFNKSKGVFVAVSELVKSHGKEKSEQGASGLSPIFTKGFALNALYAAALISSGALSFLVPTDALAWDNEVYACDGQIGVSNAAFDNRGNSWNVCHLPAGSVALNLTNSGSSTLGSVGTEAVAIGIKSTAGSYAVGLGTWADATGNSSVAIGRDADANASNAVALGSYAKAKNTESIALGNNANVSGNYSIAIGGTYNDTGRIGKSGSLGATAHTNFSVVIGAGSIANKDSGNAQTILGSNSMGAGTQSVVVGNTSGASAQSIALGSNVFARGEGSIAIGNDDLIGTLNWTSTEAQDYIVKLPNGAGGSPDTLHSIFSDLYSGGWYYANQSAFDSSYNAIERNTGKDYRIFSPTYAKGRGSIAIGSRTVAAGDVSTAVGSLAFAFANKSTAIGIRSFVATAATGGTAIGEKSTVFSSNSVAIGNLTEAADPGTVSYGYKAYAVGKDSIAIGNNVAAAVSIANGDAIIAAYGVTDDGPTDMDAVKGVITTYFDGSGNTASKFITNKDGTVYLTVGSEDIKKSTSQGTNAIVLGNRSLALKENGVAVGYGSLVDAQNSISVGSYNYIKTLSRNTLVVGLNNRILSGVREGQNINGQNNTVIGSNNVIKSRTGDSLVLGSYSQLGIQSGASLTLGKNVAIGDNAFQSIAFGQNASIGNNSNNSAAIGVSSSVGAGSVRSMAIGVSSAIGSRAGNSISFGYNAAVKDGAFNAMAIGLNSSVEENAHDSVAFGIGASATVDSALALGNQSVASFANSVALGFQSRTDYTLEDYKKDPWTAEGAIATPTSTKTGVISVGSKGQERRITNVASGALNTDAVNVSQLKTIEDKFQTEISSLKQGSGSQYLSIERKNSSGRAGALAASIAKTDNYQDYVEMRAQLAYLNARREVNGEIFDQASYDKYAQAVNELGALYEGAIANTASSLKATDRAIAEAKAKLTNLRGEELEKKRAELMKGLQKTIADAQTADAARTMGGALSVADAETAKQDTNYNNDGAKGNDSIAFGWKAKTAAATGNTDATVGGKQAIAIGFESQAQKLNSIALGTQANANGIQSVAIGKGSSTSAWGAVALGGENTASGTNSVAIGASNTASGSKAIAIGSDNNVSSDKGIAIGTSLTVAGNNSGAFGDPSTVNYDNSYLIGNGSTIGTVTTDTEVGSFVMGNNVTVTKDQIFVLGNNVNTTDIGFGNSVFLGSNTGYINSTDISKYGSSYLSEIINGLTFGNFANGTAETGKILGIVSIGNSERTRRLQGVAPGLLAATSTDAINGSQLYATNAILGKLASSVKDTFGGSAALITSGAEAGKLTFTNIGGTGKTTIDDAIKAVKASVVGTAPIAVSGQTNATGGTTYTVSLNNQGVTTDKLANGAVTSDKIADGTIAEGDLSQDVKDKIDAGNNAASNTIALKDGGTGSTTAKSLKDGSITFNIKGTNGITTTANGDDITISIDATALPTNPNTGAGTTGGTGAAHWFNVNATDNTAVNYDSAKSGAKGADSIAVGRNVVANGAGTIAIGSDITSESNASTGVTNAIVMGVAAGTPLRASATEKLGANSIAIGSNAYATQQGASAIGWAASATQTLASAFGTRAAASGNRSFAGGYNAQASGASSVALGDTAKATADYSVALGSESTAGNVNKGTGANSFAMGDNAVAAGSPLLDDNKVAVLSVGNSSGTSVKYRQIQNVAAGVISETSTDAINGSQLYFTNQAVTAAKSAADTAKSAADTAKSTAEAAKTAVDGLALSFATDSGDEATGSVQLTGEGKQTLSVKGTANFVTTSSEAGSQSITIDLAQDVKTKLNNLASNPDATYATKDEIQDISGTLNFTGDASSAGSVGLKDQKLAINGTTDQIETTADAQSLTIKLAKTVTDKLAKLDNLPADLSTTLSNKADTALSNLTDAGKQVINEQIKIAKKADASNALTIETSGGENGAAKTYTIGLTDAAVKEAAGTTNLATEYAKADGSNITTPTTWNSKLGGLTFTGDGTGTTGEQKLGSSIAITGGATGDVAANNIKVTASNSGLQVQLAKALSGLGSATFDNTAGGTTKVDGNGITITPGSGDPVKLTNAGLDNGGHKIVNIAKGDADTDAATVKQVKDAVEGASFKLAGNTTTGTPTVKSKDGTLTVSGADGIATEASATGITVKLDATTKTKLDSLDTNLASKAAANASNITGDNLTSWQNALGTISFKGDDDSAIARKLGETLAIKGGATGEVAEGNIKVSNSNNSLLIQLTKTLTGLTSVTADTVNAGSLVLGGDGNTTTLSMNGGALDVGGAKLTNLGVGNVADGSTDAVTGAQLNEVKKSIATATSIHYAATTSVDGAGQSVALTTGLTFLGDGNIDTSIEGGGKVKFALDKTLTGLTSATFGETNGARTAVNQAGVTITPASGDAISLTAEGLNNGGKVISNVGNGSIAEGSTNAVNGGEVYTALQAKANANQTFALLDKAGKSTATQQLSKTGGIQFKITGTDDVTTTADDTASTIKIGVNKIDTGAGIVANEAKLVSAGAVYSAITGAKTKVTADTADNLLEVTPTSGTGLAADSYALKVSKSAVQTMITNSLNAQGNITFQDQSGTGKGVALGQAIKINGQSGWIDAKWDASATTPTLNLTVGEQIKNAVAAINNNQGGGSTSATTIWYKANANTDGARQVSFMQGFDFRGAGEYTNTNTTEPAGSGATTTTKTINKNVLVSIEPSTTGGNTAGVVNFSLADDLTGVNSIAGNKTEGSATDDAAKITLTPKGSNDKATVNVNDAQIAGVAAGKIADDSDNAVTGKQLADLAKKLGLVKEDGGLNTTTDGTGFNDLTLDKIGTNTEAPSNIVEAVKQLTTAANGGLTFGADKGAASSVALGKTLNVVRASEAIQDSDINYAGTNLRTKVSAADTDNPAKIEIGLSEKPNFETVTVGNAAGTAGAGVSLAVADSKLKLSTGSNADPVGLTGLKAGSVAADSTDAVTGAQLASLKDILGSDFTVDNGKIVAPKVVNGADDAPATGGIGGTGKSTVNEAIAEAVRLAGAASGTNIAYRAKNGDMTSDPQSVALTTGLTFTGGTNTKATVAANGVVTFDVKPQLSGITEIKGAESAADADDAATISLQPKDQNDTAAVDVNGAKVSGIAASSIATDGKDAVTTGQLKDLADQLGIAPKNGDTTKFATPTFATIGSNTEAPTTLKGAVDQLIGSVNGGLTFTADNAGTSAAVGLGKKLSVVHAGTAITDNSINYAGTNLRTKVTAAANNDPAKIEIGLSEKPNFDTVTVGNAAGTAGAGVTLSKTTDGALKLGSGSAGNDAVKLTNLAAGSLADDSKDAVTGDQIHDALSKLKDALGSGFTLDNSGNITAPAATTAEGSTTPTGGIGGTGKTTLEDAIKAAYDKASSGLSADAAKLNYTANTGTKKEVALFDGLNFLNGTNTTVTVEDAGKVKVDINSVLKNISIISSGDGGETATSLTLSDAGVTLNNKAITGVADGKLGSTSTDAVTGKQLKDLADKLGIATNGTDGTGFTAPTLNKVGNAATPPSSILDAVNQLATASSNGLSFVTDDEATQKMPLGSTVSLKTASTKAVSGTTYAGDNLYTWAGDNGLMNIGFSQTPFFTKVVIGGSATSGGITLAKDGDKLKVGSGTEGATAVQLSNIKAGAIGDSSTDAINGTQLQSLLNVLGGLTVDPNTNLVKAPIATPSAEDKGGIGGTGATTVEDAIKTIAEQAKANAANSQLTLRANSKDTDKQTVALSQGLDFVDGTNTTASISGTGKVKVDLNKDLKNITSISSGTDDSATKISLGKDAQGNKQVDLNGAKLTGLGKGSVAKDSTDAVTGGQLFDVKESMKTLSSGVDTVKKDITNLSTTVNNVETKVTNVEKKVDKGIQLTTNGAEAQKVQMGNTINVKNGVNTKVSAIESKDGVFSYSINVNGIPMSYVNSQGETLAKIGDTFVVVNPDGSLVTDLDMSKPENVDRVKPAGVKLVNAAEANKPMTLDNVANGTIAAGSQQAVNGGQVADLVGTKVAEVDDGQGGKKTVIVGDDGKGVGSTGAKTISEAVKVVNDKATNAETIANEAKEIAKTSGVSEIVGDADSGVIVEKKDNASGNGKSYTVKLGNKIKTKEVEADKVTAKEVVADKVSAKQVDTDLITLGGGKVSMIAGEDEDGVSVLAVGSEKAPTRIRGIADGVAPTDAVNMRQFGEVTNRLSKQINEVSRDANAGIAGAMAMSGLPQAADPGASMVSMAGSSFKGETAMAFGVSRRSDSGKFILKANGSVNSRGDTGVTVGVGYQWR